MLQQWGVLYNWIYLAIVKSTSGASFTSMHYCNVIMGTIVSQITSLTIVYSTVYSDADQRKHQSSASLAFVRGIHRGPVNSPHKWPVTRKMFPFDDVIRFYLRLEDEWGIVSRVFIFNSRCGWGGNYKNNTKYDPYIKGRKVHSQTASTASKE